MSAVAARGIMSILIVLSVKPVQCFLFLTFLTEPGGEHL
jgi:hypothetical protein